MDWLILGYIFIWRRDVEFQAIKWEAFNKVIRAMLVRGCEVS